VIKCDDVINYSKRGCPGPISKKGIFLVFKGLSVLRSGSVDLPGKDSSRANVCRSILSNKHNYSLTRGGGDSHIESLGTGDTWACGGFPC
jgi:hypothetical protein